MARPSFFEDNELEIEISALEIKNVCDQFFSGRVVIFSVPNQVGSYELALGSQSITLFDPKGNLNTIIANGTLEIQSIDATDGDSVTGRIVGESNDDNFVDGNFTIVYCPE